MRILSTKAYRAMRDEINDLTAKLNVSKLEYEKLNDKYLRLSGDCDFLKMENERLAKELA
jgi:hypothetical protein